MNGGLNVRQSSPDDRGAGNQHHVPTGLDPFAPDGLTQQSFGAITHNGAADPAARHHGSAALKRIFQSVGRDDNNERVGVRSSFTPHPLNIG